MLVDWMVNEYSNVFDDNSLECQKDAQKDFGNILLIRGYKEDDPEIHCECKHPMHWDEITGRYLNRR